MKKIVYILKTKLHYYPPCVTQIRTLKKLGVDIEVLYGTCHDKTLEILKNENIPCKKIGNLKDENNSLVKKLFSWIDFRNNIFKEIKKYDSDNTIFWLGTAETAIPLMLKIEKYDYVLTLLELLDDDRKKRFLLKSIIKNAKVVTCCENTRAWLVKYWYSLSNLPYVFPNKPYEHPREKMCKPSSNLTSEIIDNIKNSNILLSQGVLQTPEELIEFAKALNFTKKKYKFVLMGIDKYNCVNELKKYYDDIYYIEYVPAPLHLEITSYARIGIIFYRPNCLNKAFCAPNKIFEFSGYGIPIIGNDIPGLTNTIGANNAGICTKLVQENIIKAIDEIDAHYDKFSKNASKYFESIDNTQNLEKLAKEIGCL